jgi:hypothetical protein
MAHPNSYPGRWPEPVGPLRIVLVDEFGVSSLDGVWRPYGTDLCREAPHLINQFPISRGRLDRMACVPADWDSIEPFVFTEHGRIPIGRLPPEYLHVVMCRVVGGRVIRLRIMRDWQPEVA